MRVVGVFLVLSLSGIVGCSSISVESEGEGFVGIHPKFSSTNTTDVLVVHGMCSKNVAWFKEHVDIFAERLGAAGDPQIKVQNINDGVQLHEASISTSSGDLNLHGLIYSGATSSYKVELENAQVRGSRALINKKIKSFAMNDCLADVTIYGGQVGKIIRSGVRDALSVIYKKRSIEGRSGDRVVLISESLGSKVVRDSLLCDRSENADDGFRLLANSDVFAMYANQIAFLDLLDGESCNLEEIKGALFSFGISVPELDGTFYDILRLLSNPEATQLLGFDQGVDTPRYWVAYSDPNGILSYKLNLEKYGGLEFIEVTNVSVQNTTNWLGIFADPVKAHNGYRSNKKVQDMLLRGCVLNKQTCDLGSLE